MKVDVIKVEELGFTPLKAMSMSRVPSIGEKIVIDSEDGIKFGDVFEVVDVHFFENESENPKILISKIGLYCDLQTNLLATYFSK